MDFVMIKELIFRLLAAGLCGIIIGLERELRAKEAGVRTHFMVCLGSALIMMVSIYGFIYIKDAPGLVRPADAARIAAQIVSGIGFIGAGTIMVNRSNITGLTTAAGLWAVAGIGMAIGGGLYVLGICATLFVLASLEILQLVFRRARFHNFTLVYNTGRRDAIDALDKALRKSGWRSIAHEIAVRPAPEGDAYQVPVTMQKHDAIGNDDLLSFIRDFPDIRLEKITFPR